MSSPARSTRSWQALVLDMISFSEKALSYAQDLGKDEFLASQPNYDATLWNIVLIGEAASNVPATITDPHPEISWREIVGTRHHLVHGYFRIDQDIVWDIVGNHLHNLLPQLYALVETSVHESSSSI